MINLKYAGEKTSYEVNFKKVNSHVVQITGEFLVKTKGFVLFRDEADDDTWDYSEYTTVYREIEGGVQFSDDESVYVAPPDPEPEPEPEPYVPTLEEVKEEKIAEMYSIQQGMVQGGINVTLASGETEHFALSDYEQKRLMALQAKVVAGDEKIPWHTSNPEDPCRYFSNADMSKIINEAMEFATYHETYFRDLARYVRSLEDKESVENIMYGMVVPEEFRSEVLVDMYAVQDAGREV